jgi:uncharacterized repeat protein (TIGR03803 family)
MSVPRGLRVRPSESLLSATLWLVMASLSAKTQTFTIVLSFGAPNDGAYPLDPLLRDFQGNVYGASQGGGLGWGTVFEITASGQERVLYNFQDGADGMLPFLS